MTGEVDELISCKGKRVVRVDLKRARPADDELAELMLGPTGNLRAPAIRVGRALIIGFDPGTYEERLT
jgi:arsenate reductase-like glutaredoxin family protein